MKSLGLKLNFDRIGTKLLSGNIAILVVLTLIVIGSGVNFYWTKVSLNRTNEIFVPQISMANTIKQTVLQQQVIVESYITNPSLELKNQYRDLDRVFDDTYARIKSLPLNSSDDSLIEQVKYEHDNFTSIANNVFRYSDKKSKLVKTLLDNYNLSVLRVVDSSDKLVNSYNEDLGKSIDVTGRSLNVALTVMVVMTLLTLVGALIFTFVLTKRITRPMKDMINASQEIAQGDLRQRVEIKDRGELGFLAISFNSMVDNLNILIQEVITASNYIVKVSQEFRQHASDSALASNTADSVLDAVVESSATQSTTVTSVLNSTNHVAVAIEQINDAIIDINQRNSQTTSLAEGSKSAVDEAFKQMNVIKDTITLLNSNIMELTNRLSEISHIIDLMENFTEQTNLLALNASIEAARVGEQGKGFAVVANQIRALADESSKSLDKIRTVIDNIFERSVSTAKTMSDGKKVVESGSRAMQTVSSSLNEIINFISSSVEQFRGLVGASEHISSNSKLIVQDIRDLENVAKETVSHAETLRMVINRQTAAVVEAAASLDQIATTLEQSTGKFTLTKIR